MDFSKYRVPSATMGCIFVSLIISVVLPIALLIIWRTKTKAKISSFFFGAGPFVVFALILESILHNVLLMVMGQEAFSALPFKAVYGGLAAGVFEEFGRYIVMILFMKKYLTKKEGIMFGIGHGGIESILITGITCISNLVIAMMLNSGQGNLITRGYNSDMQMQLYNQISPLWNSAPSMFLWAGIERISAITFHICASYLVYRAVKDRKFVLCLLAVLLHAVMDGVMVVIQSTFDSYLVTEVYLIVFSLIFAVFTVRAYLKEKEETDDLQPFVNAE